MAQISAARELAKMKGDDIPDIGSLRAGQFYIATEGGDSGSSSLADGNPDIGDHAVTVLAAELTDPASSRYLRNQTGVPNDVGLENRQVGLIQKVSGSGAALRPQTLMGAL